MPGSRKAPGAEWDGGDFADCVLRQIQTKRQLTVVLRQVQAAGSWTVVR
jgi:hypothetical protein